MTHAALDGSYTSALCRVELPRWVTRSYERVDCERCLYLLDINARRLDFQAAIAFGTAAVFAIRRKAAAEDVWELAHCAGHFALRLLEEAAA